MRNIRKLKIISDGLDLLAEMVTAENIVIFSIFIPEIESYMKVAKQVGGYDINYTLLSKNGRAASFYYTIINNYVNDAIFIITTKQDKDRIVNKFLKSRGYNSIKDLKCVGGLVEMFTTSEDKSS